MGKGEYRSQCVWLKSEGSWTFGTVERTGYLRGNTRLKEQGRKEEGKAEKGGRTLWSNRWLGTKKKERTGEWRSRNSVGGGVGAGLKSCGAV